MPKKQPDEVIEEVKPEKILKYYPEISTDTDEMIQARKDTHQIELRR